LQVTLAAKDVEFSGWNGDILAVAVTEKDLQPGAPDSKFENAVLNRLDGQLGGLLSAAAAEEDFTGKPGQSVVLRVQGQAFKRVALIGFVAHNAACLQGLGESVASVAKAAKAARAAIVLASPSAIQGELFKLNAAAAIASGTLTSADAAGMVVIECISLMLLEWDYNFCLFELHVGTVLGLHEDTRYKSEWKKVHLKQVDLIGMGSGPEVDQKLKHANHVSSGVMLGRDLVTSPANVLTPGQYSSQQ